MKTRKSVFYFMAEGGEVIYGQEACTEHEARQKLRALGIRGKLDLMFRRGCCCDNVCTNE